MQCGMSVSPGSFCRCTRLHFAEQWHEFADKKGNQTALAKDNWSDDVTSAQMSAGLPSGCLHTHAAE